jgi:3'-phosphoadenosine 5'-phosphosulfate sulfotransferase (PAPS reductase)/FAD synthetase
MKNKIIAWFSGGITSAVACHLSLNIFKNVEIVFIDTKNEDDDTYRFLADCEHFYMKEIKIISSNKYNSIDEVWEKNLSLNTGYGAICSTRLKRDVRENYQDLDIHFGQVFGFDPSEKRRMINMNRNYPEINSICPLIINNITKQDCVNIIKSWNIILPLSYRNGFRNNNCRKTGCVRGGKGYWLKIKKEEPEIFQRMVDREIKLTALKGKPVTVFKDCFLTELDESKKYTVEPLQECMGFCSTMDKIYEQFIDQ